MFGSRQQPPIRTLIGEHTVIEGELRFTEGLRIDGRVLGSVVALGSAANLLVIGEKASIAGHIKAGHVIVNGEVRGAIDCTQLLDLQPKARVEGPVRYVRLEMHQGAHVNGELKAMPIPDDKPGLKLATNAGMAAIGHNAGDRQTKESS